jgi:ribosomal protein S18 acetylase RimI-like enzyme
MRIRPFTGWDDLAAMQEVCRARLLASPGRAQAHPGDIAWWAGWPPRPMEALSQMFLLWEVGPEVVGFAAYAPEERDLALIVKPRHENGRDAIPFEDEAAAWASRGGVPARWMEFDDESAAVERWHRRGYRPTDTGALNLVLRLEPFLGEAADGHVHAVGEDDVGDRARIMRDAFEDAKPASEYTADYEAFRGSPAYPDGWDLLLRDEEGDASACCIAWPDPSTGAATFEPVATHPSMHRRGFATALLREGARRLAAAGMTYAIVGVDLDNPGAEALYRSLGFQPDRVLRWYERC